MDPGHHTAFLLAILVCIILLLLTGSALLVCYCRRKYLKAKNWSLSMRKQGLKRDQATSMTSFTLNIIEQKPITYNAPKTLQSSPSLPIIVDKNYQKSTLLSSCLSLESPTVVMSDEEDCSRKSELVKTSIKNKRETTGRSSAIYCAFSSGASVLSSLLDKSSMFSLKAKRRSSSMKSGLDPDILLVPIASPVQAASSSAGQLQAASLPRKLSHSTLLCDNSNNQEFTWNTAGVSILSNHAGHKESLSVPGTLERKSYISEEKDSSRQDLVQLRKPPFYLQPKAWFVSFGNRPLSDGAQVGSEELANVTSLDSGVDIIEVPMRKESGGYIKNLTKATCVSKMNDHLTVRSPNGQKPETESYKADQLHEVELSISHREAARKLNEEYHGRSLWQKWEDRPLMGVN
ncbi:uncharacterized protein WCC33_001169 [Rhinophrynus dorsalis]